MTSWKRITLVVFVLIGGTMVFSYWSYNQFNTVFNDLETALTANILLASSPLATPTALASISFETTLTADMLLAPPSPELSFHFPQKDSEVYIGCTYPISWQSSTPIHALGVVLIDVGTRESIDPTASSLARENVVGTGSQNLNWNVGVVRPGEYYIEVSKINGADVEMRSEVFTISTIPKATTTEEQEEICKKSGGLL